MTAAPLDPAAIKRNHRNIGPTARRGLPMHPYVCAAGCPGSDELCDAYRLAEVAVKHAAGADPDPRAINVQPTPGQLWHELLCSSRDERLEILKRAIGASGKAERCLVMNHDQAIQENTRLAADLAAAQAKVEAASSLRYWRLIDGNASELARALIRAVDHGEPYTPQPRGVRATGDVCNSLAFGGVNSDDEHHCVKLTDPEFKLLENAHHEGPCADATHWWWCGRHPQVFALAGEGA